MGKLASRLLYILGRMVKGVIACSLIPPLVALIMVLREDLSSLYASSKSLSGWIDVGAISYLGFHLLIYKPITLFRLQHNLLSTIASWLFGSQVSTSGASKQEPKQKDSGKKKKEKSSEGSQGSTLLVLSPYLVPLYSIVFCLLSWAMRNWFEFGSLQVLMISLIGASLCMHWVMTADDLQQKRNQFAIESYVISLCIIGLVSTLVVCACLPLAVEGFSVTAALSKTITTSRDIYVWVFRGVFL